MTDKFAERAARAVKRAGMREAEARIEQIAPGPRSRFTLIIRFLCPCGHRLEERHDLVDLWKSRFDRQINSIERNLAAHVADEIARAVIAA